MNGALSPYRIVDLSTDTGWLCGKILADLGADVIKVEPPGGDPGRRRGRFDHRHPGDAEHNLGWRFANQHKRSVVLDLHDGGDRDRLLELAAGADALIESFPTGTLEQLDLSPDRLLALNPQLVVTSISPFGRTGPYAHHAASDLTVSAMCGLQWLTGDEDRAPVRIGAPQLFRHAAAEAAAQTAIALHHAARSGTGQHVDVAAQLAGIRTLMNAQSFHLLEHRELMRVGPYAGYSHARFRMVMPCADGHVAALIVGGQLGGTAMRTLFDWAHAEGVAVDPAADAMDFREVNFATMDTAFFDGVCGTLEALFARHTKAEIYERAVQDRLLVAPLSDVADLRDDVQLADRGFFQPLPDGTGTVPGRWARLSATPLRAPSPAPRIGQHGAEVLAEPRRRPAPAAAEGNTAPFEGLRVLDLSWVGVGPMTAGYLANQGATVIKVESSARPDILRLTPPFLDGRPGLNNSHFCANMNASKAGLGVDLARPEGRAVVWRIIEEWADVVLESFTPRTLRGWGMDWAAVSARRPDIVMLSTCMQGQTGPRADYRGFGNLMGALSGFYSITGWPDRPPVTVYGAYTDFICQRFATTAITAAIDHRRRTGAGQYIDLAQLEAALQFLGPEFLDLDRNGHVATRAGNRDPERCPHVVLPCRPDADGREGWLALACEDDGQWAALVDALGRPAWATDPALVTVAGRKAAEDRIEAELAAWSAGWDAVELFERLQPAIPCGPVLAPARLHTDPQVRHRGYFVPLRHSVMGEVPYDGVAAVLSATPARLTRAAPCLGEDTFTVLTELIGMDPDEVAQLLADGVVEITG